MYNQNVEKRPAKVQGQLPVSEQSNHQKNGFAGKKVSVESQRQRYWFGKKTWQLEQKVERNGVLTKRLKCKLSQEATQPFYLDAIKDYQEKHTHRETKRDIEICSGNGAKISM